MDYRIGLDIGVNTGIAVYNEGTKKLEVVQTLDIDDSYEIIKRYCSEYRITVYLEDVTKIGGSHAMAQGAGSIKRDYGIWIKRFNKLGISYISTRPKHNRSLLFKCTDEFFRVQTGWDKRTSQHARDAVALIWFD